MIRIPSITGEGVGAYLPGVRCLDTVLLSFLDDQRWGGSDGPDQIGSTYALSRQRRTDSLRQELT